MAYIAKYQPAGARYRNRPFSEVFGEKSPYDLRISPAMNPSDDPIGRGGVLIPQTGSTRDFPWSGTSGQGKPVKPGKGGGPDLKKAIRKTGYASILDILLSGGRTDPALFNRELQAIGRGTEANQMDIEQALAASNLSGSGLGQALLGAAGEAGAERTSQAYAEESAKTEERRRSDIVNLLLPLLQLKSQRRGQNLALQAALAGGKGGSNLGSYGNILGQLGNLLKGLNLGSGDGGGGGNVGGGWADSAGTWDDDTGGGATYQDPNTGNWWL